MIQTVKQLKAENIVGHSVYKLSAPLKVYVDNEISEWTTDEYFGYDGKVLRSGSDGSLINPAILFKAKIYLLTISEWTKPKLQLGNLRGEEGNAFVILGRASKVAKAYGMDWDAINADAKSGDYEHLLAVLDKHFFVEAIR